MYIGVTRVGNRWHARLFIGETRVKPGELLDEMACEQKCDVGWICREMLRWADKLGMSNSWAAAARARQNSNPTGKVWYKKSLCNKIVM